LDERKVARLITDAVVRRPMLWRLLRGRTRDIFERVAPTWETRLRLGHLAALELALADVERPARVLDVGTGTGVAALALAARSPGADVTGLDLSPAMLAEAERKRVTGVHDRVRFQVGDASALPFHDGSFDLVVLMNAIPFFDELSRVTAPGGTVTLSFSRGAETPIFVPESTLRRELGRRGFADFAAFAAPPATALRVRRR
jgi:ubiquinone/menaquinone biosynthesis C-methylase UbiE